MKLYGDTANLDELREMESMGLLSGVTTNPTILSQQGADAMATLRKITALLPDYPIFAQVTAQDHQGMVEQGKKINTAGSHMVVKIPATNEGLKAIAALRKIGIRTCATAILTSAEALLCSLAGASYVAPYTGQNEQVGFSGIQTLKEIVTILKTADTDTEVLAASIEKPQELAEVAMTGAQIATITYQQMMDVCGRAAPLTDFYVDRFFNDWNRNHCYF